MFAAARATSAALVFLLPHSCDKQDCSGLINSFWMAAFRQRLVGTNGVWSAVPVTNLSLPDFNDAGHSCGPDVPNKSRLINHTNAVKAVGFVFIWDQFSCNVELAIRDVKFAAVCRPTLEPNDGFQIIYLLYERTLEHTSKIHTY